MARIYIADDDPDIRQILTFHLTEQGHEVAAFKDGALILEITLLDPPDLMVLDLRMPNMDGFSVIEALDMAGALDSIGVMILSAQGSEHDVQRGLELGAHHYMFKPFAPEEFVATISELCALTKEQLDDRRDSERARSSLLTQLEDLFTEPG